VTGWLRDPDRVEEWTRVMEKALYGLSEEERERMSRAGMERVKKNFAVGQMAKRLDELFGEVELEVQTRPRKVRPSVVALGVVGLVLALLGTWAVSRLLVSLRGSLSALDRRLGY
jgi:alpha-1,3/alpha-1,6-mannosyltransferase